MNEIGKMIANGEFISGGILGIIITVVILQ